jgi:glycosyltransferase involved in cell wall biosynthesis
MTLQARVLLVTENLPLAQDHRLRKQAASLLKAGVGVTVICRRHPSNDCVGEVIVRDYPAPAETPSKLGYLWEYAWSLACAFWQVVRCLRSEGFDAIQIASTPDIYFVLAFPLRLMKKRVVFDARDLSPEIYTRRFGAKRGLIPLVLRFMERASYRTANTVLAVNASVAEVAMTRGGVPPRRIEIVGNGPVMSGRAPKKLEQQPEKDLLCCFVGVMGPQDGTELAIRAIALLEAHGRRRDAQFVFAGTGDALPSLRELAHEQGLCAFMHFPGWLRPEEVEALLNEADLGLEPNIEDFVSPVKVMEYMAHGLPVVAFELRETRNVIGPSAPLAPPSDVAGFADRIEALLGDPHERERLGLQGRLRAEQILAWEHQEAVYVGVYRRLLGSPAETASILKVVE